MEHLHGTPAYVKRLTDGQIYRVRDLFFDGDRKGYAVKIITPKKPMLLYPGEYRTFSVYCWNEKTQKINIIILE